MLYKLNLYVQNEDFVNNVNILDIELILVYENLVQNWFACASWEVISFKRH